MYTGDALRGLEIEKLKVMKIDGQTIYFLIVWLPVTNPRRVEGRLARAGG